MGKKKGGVQNSQTEYNTLFENEKEMFKKYIESDEDYIFLLENDEKIKKIYKQLEYLCIFHNIEYTTGAIGKIINIIKENQNNLDNYIQILNDLNTTYINKFKKEFKNAIITKSTDKKMIKFILNYYITFNNAINLKKVIFTDKNNKNIEYFYDNVNVNSEWNSEKNYNVSNDDYEWKQSVIGGDEMKEDNINIIEKDLNDFVDFLTILFCMHVFETNLDYKNDNIVYIFCDSINTIMYDKKEDMKKDLLFYPGKIYVEFYKYENPVIINSYHNFIKYLINFYDAYEDKNINILINNKYIKKVISKNTIARLDKLYDEIIRFINFYDLEKIQFYFDIEKLYDETIDEDKISLESFRQQIVDYNLKKIISLKKIICTDILNIRVFRDDDLYKNLENFIKKYTEKYNKIENYDSFKNEYNNDMEVCFDIYFKPFFEKNENLELQYKKYIFNYPNIDKEFNKRIEKIRNNNMILNLISSYNKKKDPEYKKRVDELVVQAKDKFLSYKKTKELTGGKYIKTNDIFVDKKGIKRTLYKKNKCSYIKVKSPDNKFVYKKIKS
jgi:hypothetical protein